MKRFFAILDRIGSVGALVAAIAAPCCFPVFAAVGAAVGLGGLGRFEGPVLYAFQGFVLLSLVGFLGAFRRQKRIGPLALGLASVASIFFALHFEFSSLALYAGLAGLLVTAAWNYFGSSPASFHESASPILRSVITCPHCAHASEETMPTDTCRFFYDCPACGARLRPKDGDCCVFCSYGSVKCPSKQTGASCCG